MSEKKRLNAKGCSMRGRKSCTHAVQTARASQFAKPRAQRTTTEEVPEFSRPSALARSTSSRGSWLLPLVLGMLCALLLALAGSIALSWSGRFIDDIHGK